MILPNKLSDGGLFAQQNRAINALIDYVRSLEIRPSPTVKINRTSSGTILEAAAESSSTGSGMRWMGTWDSSKKYKTGDLVVITGSANAGAWVANVDINPGDAPTDPPETNTKWVAIAPGATFGYYG